MCRRLMENPGHTGLLDMLASIDAMDLIAMEGHSLRPSTSLLTGQGIALVCWMVVVALGYVAWRRRRADDACDMLIVAGLWLAARIGLLVAGLPGNGQLGEDWLLAALDLTGLVLSAVDQDQEQVESLVVVVHDARYPFRRRR